MLPWEYSRPFQSFTWPGGGSEVQMPKIKVAIKPIEMKLCISHYSHKSMPDAKCESGSFSIYMTSQNFYFWRYDMTKFLTGEGNKSSNSAIYIGKYVQHKLIPHVNVSNFQAEENFISR